MIRRLMPLRVSFHKAVVAAALLVLAGAAAGTSAQEEIALTATRRVFPEAGAGVRSVKCDAAGNYYVLTGTGASVSVYDPAGKLLRKLPPGGGGATAATFGEDMDVDAKGNVYVADRGANAVRIWNADGSARTFPVSGPFSIAALGEGEVAVATLLGPHLVTVYDTAGKVLREIGEPEDISSHKELNRFLNIGQLARDAKNRLYYGFLYLPEPTVRVFDRLGYAGGDIQVTSLDVMPRAQAARREIEKEEKRGEAPRPQRVLSAVGVDPATGEAWIALENVLHRFDADGNRRGSYRIYTKQGARLEVTTILIEPGKMLVGNDPIGIYEFERPDRNPDGTRKFAN
ncbi:MAG TPA: hypothetical protein VEH49_05410 [Methylomirabilota bacterium]|nr:hypothetical protein [Methylomirabilota bacterium]